MGFESLNHKQLKTEARKLLKEKYGFKDDEIYEEQEYIFTNSIRIVVDVVGKNSESLIVVECGNTDKLRLEKLKEELGKNNVIHMPYNDKILEPHFYIEPKSRPEKLRLLKSIYNRYIYEKLKEDPDFELVEFNEELEPDFYIGKKKWVWMAFPTKRSGIVGKDLQYEINFTIDYKSDNKYEITINAETNSSIKQFIDLSQSTKEKLVYELQKLPFGFLTQDGIKYKTKTVRGPPLPRNWEINPPIPSNQMSKEKLEEIEKRIKWYLEEGKKFEEYPVFTLAKIEVSKEELAKAMLALKPIYVLSFKFKTQKAENNRRVTIESLKQRIHLYEIGLSDESEEDIEMAKKAIKDLEND